MRKLLLTSTKIDLLPTLIAGNPAEAKLIFVPTAANVYEDKWFVEADRERLGELGFNLTELDMNGQTPESLRAAMHDADVIYVAGGNSFYLIQKIQESGFGEIVKDLAEEGTLYVGASAGAVVAGPSVEPMKFLDDSSEAPGLKSFEGMGLVDFVVLPHYGKEKYKKRYEETMQEFGGKGLKLVPLTDKQSIIVEGGQLSDSRINVWRIWNQEYRKLKKGM